jgi:uncharacterized protein (TIRG00374 family)
VFARPLTRPSATLSRRERDQARRPWYNSAPLKRILQITLAVVLTIVFLGWFFWNTDLRQVWAIMKSANPFWLLGGMLINVAALVFRTMRWRVILRSENPPPFYPTFFANTVGYGLSTVLPVRAGDFARPALLARRTDIPFTGALGTVLAERVLDLTSILTLFVYYALVHWTHFSNDPRTSGAFFIIKAGAIGALIALASLVVLVVFVYFFRAKLRGAHQIVGGLLPARFRTPWMQFFDSFTASLDLVRKRGALSRVLLYTAGVWGCLTSQFWFVVMALHRPLPLDSGFFVTGITTIGLAVPTPGGVGGFHKACQIVLTKFYLFDIDSSVAVAILFHVVGTLPVLVVGLLLFLREGLNLRQLTEETHVEKS